MLLLVRSSLLAIFFVVPVLGSLYECHEDGTSPFGWLHAIMLGMGVSVAAAASILTVCGLRSCTNGVLRDTLAQPARWLDLLRLLSDDVVRALELQRSIHDEHVDQSEVTTHLDTEMKHSLLLPRRPEDDSKRAKVEGSGAASSSSGSIRPRAKLAERKNARQTRESFRFSAQTREISRCEQTREISEACKSILPTHDRALLYITNATVRSHHLFTQFRRFSEKA